MGYNIQINESEFQIKKEHFGNVLAAISNIPERLSWTTMSELKFLCDAEDIEKVFDYLSWPVELDCHGNICDISFEAEKQGDEAVWFEAIAPWVSSGSFIEVCGEDGDLWRWYFINGHFEEIQPEIIWRLK